MRSIILTTLLFLFTIGTVLEASPINDPSRIVIDLPSTYTVTDTEQKKITLGDLASSIDASNSELVEKYKALPILDAPEPGKIAHLPYNYIIQTIRREGLDYTHLHFTGEKLVEIYGIGRFLDFQTIVQKIEEYVLQESGWSKTGLVLRVISNPPKDLWVPLKTVEIMIDRISPSLYGDIRFEVTLFIDRIQYTRFPVITSVSHRRSVYMVTSMMKRGEVISSSDIREVVQYINQEIVDRQTVEDPHEIVGSKCRTPLNKGDMIKWNNLDVNYVVNRGDKVKLVVQKNGFTMQTVGKALKNGAIGDVVPIKADSTERILNGRIIQRGLVEITTS